MTNLSNAEIMFIFLLSFLWVAKLIIAIIEIDIFVTGEKASPDTGSNRGEGGSATPHNGVQSEDWVPSLLRELARFVRNAAVPTMLGVGAGSSGRLLQLRGERLPVP